MECIPNTPNSVLNHVNAITLISAKTVPFVKQIYTKQIFSFCVTSYIQTALLRVKGGSAKYPEAVNVSSVNDVADTYKVPI